MKTTSENFTSTSSNQKSISLEAIGEALKQVALLEEYREVDKDLGIQAAHLKYNCPDDYAKLSDEDKALINKAIDRAFFIIKQENEEKIMGRFSKPHQPIKEEK